MEQRPDEDEDAWGPADVAPPAPARPSGATAPAGNNGAARPPSGAPGGGRSSSSGGGGGGGGVAGRISAEEVWRLKPLLDLRLSPGGASGPGHRRGSHARTSAGPTARGAQPRDTTSAGGSEAHAGILPLRSLALGVVARHVSELAAALGPDGCGWLPSEAKASLLAAARRRGELTDAVLLALADAAFLSLDVSGSRVGGAALLQAAARMPKLRALDATGCARVSAGALRKLPRAAPGLALLRLGGGGEAGDAAARALPRIVPAICPEVAAEEGDHLGGGGGGGVAAAAAAAACAGDGGAPAASVAAAAAAAGPVAAGSAAADSWEDLAASDQEGGGDAPRASDRDGWAAAGASEAAGAAGAPGVSGGAGGGAGRLWQLRAVVWPDCPREVRDALRLLCPRVALNPCGDAAAAAAAAGGLLRGLPRELDPSVALDEAAFAPVGPAALEYLCAPAGSGDAFTGPSVADRFRQAYIDRDQRRRAREARLAAAEERRAARDKLARSGGARVLSSWLDEM